MGRLRQFRRALIGVAYFVMIITGTFLAVRSRASVLRRRSSNSTNVQTNNASSEGTTAFPTSKSGSSPGTTLPSENQVTAILSRNDSARNSNAETTTHKETQLHTTAGPRTDATVLTVSVYSTKPSNSNVTAVTKKTVTTVTGSGATSHTVKQTRSSITNAATTTVTSQNSTGSPNETMSKGRTAPTNLTITLDETATVNGTLSNALPGAGGLSPVLAAIVGVVCSFVFFATVFAVAKLVNSFKTFRFRRLQEVPMDDFEDYSGVYVEHTVPFKG